MTQNELYGFFEQLKEPLRQYKENKEKRMDPGFNVFYLISDYYYRETFHGDIIATLLSPDEKHGEGNLYIDLFIDMINEQKQLVDSQYYQTPIVIKEFSTNDGELSGRIDIIIEGDKHCIVIENKLNNAPDTYQQLPKYYRDLKKKGVTVDAFVYLPLSPQKSPDSSSWNDEESREYINKHLVIIPAYYAGQVNLIENWLVPAEEKTINSDAKFIIKQYITLLNNLTIDIMDDKEILDILSSDDNFETTISILHLQESLCKKIIEEFIDNIRQQVETNGYIFQRESSRYKIEVRNPKYPSWIFIIENVGRQSGWCRYLYYNGPTVKAKHFIAWHKEQNDLPLGWDYYEDDYRYWEKPHTWISMRDGTLAKIIIAEMQNAFCEIGNQELPI